MLWLIPVMEKHGNLSLKLALREHLMKVSTSSIDRMQHAAHTTAGKNAMVQLGCLEGPRGACKCCDSETQHRNHLETKGIFYDVSC